ncbi:hypothetical protein BXZ70DRAFT_908246 [Cristinia sonorae]|uniref:Uncharacterized protein n=1 Tax=Cristinia sonorae TaxID=1940300 RepID=A0A8K0ULX2_9AGAR|nr:hypothetical protein BXZ70DRAFT_908246 [Cristinia sonorae]
MALLTETLAALPEALVSGIFTGVRSPRIFTWKSVPPVKRMPVEEEGQTAFSVHIGAKNKHTDKQNPAPSGLKRRVNTNLLFPAVAHQPKQIRGVGDAPKGHSSLLTSPTCLRHFSGSASEEEGHIIRARHGTASEFSAYIDRSSNSRHATWTKTLHLRISPLQTTSPQHSTIRILRLVLASHVKSLQRTSQSSVPTQPVVGLRGDGGEDSQMGGWVMAVCCSSEAGTLFLSLEGAGSGQGLAGWVCGAIRTSKSTVISLFGDRWLRSRAGWLGVRGYPHVQAGTLFLSLEGAGSGQGLAGWVCGAIRTSKSTIISLFGGRWLRSRAGWLGVRGYPHVQAGTLFLSLEGAGSGQGLAGWVCGAIRTSKSTVISLFGDRWLRSRAGWLGVRGYPHVQAGTLFLSLEGAGSGQGLAGWVCGAIRTSKSTVISLFGDRWLRSRAGWLGVRGYPHVQAGTLFLSLEGAGSGQGLAGWVCGAIRTSKSTVISLFGDRWLRSRAGWLGVRGYPHVQAGTLFLSLEGAGSGQGLAGWVCGAIRTSKSTVISLFGGRWLRSRTSRLGVRGYPHVQVDNYFSLRRSLAPVKGWLAGCAGLSARPSRHTISLFGGRWLRYKG